MQEENKKLTYQVRLDEMKSALEKSFSLYHCLPLGLEKGEGHKKKLSGIKGNKETWLRYYIHDEPDPKNSTVRCHGCGQKHQQKPSWILPDGRSIWNPLAWRYRLQR